MYSFKLPDLGAGMHGAEIARWLVQPGDWVKVDQSILEVITDKALVEIPSPVEGMVAALRFAEGQVAYVGDELIVFSTREGAPRATFPQLNGNAHSNGNRELQPGAKRRAILVVRKRELESEEIPFVILRLDSKDYMVKSSFPHRHRFYQVLWVTSGTGTHYIDFNEYPIQPNAVFLLAPGEVHFLRATPNLAGYNILFSADFLDLDANRQQLFSLPFFRVGHQSPALQLIEEDIREFQQIAGHLEQEFASRMPGRANMLKAYVNILLTCASRVALRCTPAHVPSPSPLIQNFILLVERHMHSKRQVSEYAELLAITPGHLNDVVKQHLGKTAGEIIRDRLLLEAKRMLFYSEGTVAEIAHQLDFEDPSYFGRFFRRYTRQAPNEFRVAIRKKYQIG